MFLRLFHGPSALAPLALATHIPQTSAPTAADRFWPQWRGPHATGVSGPPTRRSSGARPRTSGGRSKFPAAARRRPSSGAIGFSAHRGAGRLCRLTAQHAPRGGVRRATCIGSWCWRSIAQTGKTSSGSAPRAKRRRTKPRTSDNGTWASSSAITDGEHVYRVVRVARPLRLRHERQARSGRRTSATSACATSSAKAARRSLHGNTLVVVWDHHGRVVHRRARQARPARSCGASARDEIDTWATPLVVEHDGRAQVIVPGMNEMRSYDLETGDDRLGSRRADDEPDSVAGGRRRHGVPDERIPRQQPKAIRLAGAKGDITGTDAIVWTLDRDTPYVPSPLLYDGILYFLKTNNGILSAFDAKTGKPHYPAAAARRRARTCSRRRSAPPAASTSPAATARRSCSSTGRRSRCWPTNKLATASTRRRRWSTRDLPARLQVPVLHREEGFGGGGGNGVHTEGTRKTRHEEVACAGFTQAATPFVSVFSVPPFINPLLRHLPTGASMNEIDSIAAGSSKALPGPPQ